MLKQIKKVFNIFLNLNFKEYLLILIALEILAISIITLDYGIEIDKIKNQINKCELKN